MSKLTLSFILSLLIILSISGCTKQNADLYNNSNLTEQVNISTETISNKTEEPENCTDSFCLNETTCIDSDGGINPYVKGEVRIKSVNGTWITISDECEVDIDAGLSLLKEVTCENNTTLKSRYFICDGWCQQGACINHTKQCFDSDFENNVHIKGYVTIDNDTTRIYDVCISNNTLIQYACGGYDEFSRLIYRKPSYECINNCSDGVCIP